MDSTCEETESQGSLRVLRLRPSSRISATRTHLPPSKPKGLMLMIVSHNPAKIVKLTHITQNRHRHMNLLKIT